MQLVQQNPSIWNPGPAALLRHSAERNPESLRHSEVLLLERTGHDRDCRATNEMRVPLTQIVGAPGKPAKSRW
jgi:hypothetical protein